ncbi:SixA phosphatase family protein [Pseudooceanicola sp.]|uniref:SixA phosphatase family protein n=1 Tax=Pseudooceanicola sp. TaxID=1914328 RepID=UPI0040583119
MVKRLILLRHATSRPASLGTEDHARDLTPTGRREATAVGDWLRARGHGPDVILCSDARRTRETCACLELTADVHYLPDLYHASAEEMLAVLCTGNGEAVMMIGHDPGIAECAGRILKHPLQTGFAGYPPAATLVADLAVRSWDDAQFATAEMVDFVTPHELMGRDAT